MEASQASEAGSIPVARSILTPDLISPEFFRLRVSDQCWSAVSWGVSDLCGSGAVGGAGCGLKDKKSWSEPDLSALRCEKVWFKVVGGQL